MTVSHLGNRTGTGGVSGAMRALHRSLLVALTLSVLAACGSAATTAPTGTLSLVLTAGPVCPVERMPPDPGCAPRPAADQVVAILDGDREVARGTSDANGRIHFSLPYGRYVVHSVTAGTFPSPPADLVADVGAQPLELALDYDTGIR